jgi:hypothetical protein
MRLFSLVLVVIVSGCVVGPEDGDVGAATEELRGGRGNGGGCHWECPRCPHDGRMCKMMPCSLVCNGQDRQVCGDTRCGPNESCCNASCGICTERDGFCIELFCEPPTTGGCVTDDDCRLFSDYCTGCDCRALSADETDPYCEGPGVLCFADPCMGHAAVCDVATGACVVQ